MAKQVITKGNLEWVKPREKYQNGVKWVDDPNGKYEIRRFEYNWFERLLIWLRLMKDKRYNGKYIMGIDPFESETIHMMKTAFDKVQLTKEQERGGEKV